MSHLGIVEMQHNDITLMNVTMMDVKSHIECHIINVSHLGIVDGRQKSN